MLAIALSLLAAAWYAQSQAAEWFPLQVDVWKPPFNKERQHGVERYTALAKASKKWTLCVAIPHLKDPYWLAVNYGLVEEATRLGVALTIKEAGGYEKLAVQRQQLEDCMAAKVDALVIGAISKDGLNDLIARYTAQGHPVIDLINGIDSPHLTGRAAADFFEMGKLAGEYLLKNNSGKPPQVAWLPGPRGAGWAEAGDQGFRNALAGRARVMDSRWGDTGLAVQTKLLKEILNKQSNLQYIVGNAVGADAAVQELRRRGLQTQPKVMSYYFSPSIYRAIERGSIEAAPTDVPVLQARLAIDMAVKALEKIPFPPHVNARLQMVDRSTLKTLELRDSLAPDGFRPIFSVNQ